MADQTIEFLLEVRPAEYGGPILKYTAVEYFLFAAALTGLFVALLVFFWLWGRSDRQWRNMPWPGFSLDDIEKLKADNQISDREFRRIRRALARVDSRFYVGKRSVENGKPAETAAKLRPSLCPRCGCDIGKIPDRCSRCGMVIPDHMRLT